MSASLPLVLPQFMTIAQNALPAGFQVRLGKVFGPYIAPQALLITGVTFTDDEYAELGPTYRHEERYNIECVLCSTAGNDDQPTRLQEVYSLYDDLAVAVANLPTLNGTVRLAWCRQLSYSPNYDAKGLSVGTLEFEVQCQVRVTSLT